MFARIQPSVSVLREKINTHAVKLTVIAGGLLATTVPAFAQTPVPLEVPTNEIFQQTNIWMDVFAPVVAIGVGIAVALAILTFIGNEILKAFKR